jgi:hypothetical protein
LSSSPSKPRAEEARAKEGEKWEEMITKEREKCLEAKEKWLEEKEKRLEEKEKRLEEREKRLEEREKPRGGAGPREAACSGAAGGCEKA